MSGLAGRSARANRNRRETAASGEEDRDAKYPTDAEFAVEDPYPVEVPAGRRLRIGSMRTKHAIKELVAQGMSQLKIAEELGISPSSVSTIMQRHRIKKAVKGGSGDGQ